jgi:hypothetical protein
VALELTWKYWRRETSLAPARIQALDHPAHSLVSVPTMLSQVLVCMGDVRNIQKIISKPEENRCDYLEI